MFHFALPNEIFHRSRNVLDGNFGIDAVLIEEVDRIRSESLERGIGVLANALGPAVESCRGSACLEAEFRRDDNLVAKRLDGFAYQFLVEIWAVGFRRIEESHTAFESGADERDSRGLLGSGTVTEAKPHAA